MKYNTFPASQIPHSDYLQAPVREGSLVVWVDGSYALGIKAGNSKMEAIHGIEYKNGNTYELLRVVAINVSVPTSAHKSSLVPQNNCILAAPNGDIIFCSAINFCNIRTLGIHSADMRDDEVLEDCWNKHYKENHPLANAENS